MRPPLKEPERLFQTNVSRTNRSASSTIGLPAESAYVSRNLYFPAGLCEVLTVNRTVSSGTDTVRLPLARIVLVTSRSNLSKAAMVLPEPASVVPDEFIHLDELIKDDAL